MGKYFVLAVFLFFSMAVTAMSQESPCPSGPTHIVAPLGYVTTIDWTIPDSQYIQRFRLRRAQTLAGSWGVWRTITNPATRAYSFPVDGNFYYYLTAIYALPQPDGSTKTVETEGSAQVKIVVQLSELLPQTGWSVFYVDSQEVDNPATNVYDGNSNTIWHTDLANPLPHELVLNLGSIIPVGGFRYLPRQDVADRLVKDYEFYVSTDGVTWPTIPNSKGSFDTTLTLKEIKFPFVYGQYVKFKVLSGNTVSTNISVAEINILKVTNTQ